MNAFVQPQSTGPLEETRPGRFVILRTAKLTCELGEFPCMLRDISQEGLQVRLYSSLPENVREYTLEFGTGDAYSVRLVWQNDGSAGLQFNDMNDIAVLLGEKGPFRKRPIRLSVELPATFRALGNMADAVIHDISQEGARIETGHQLALDQQIRLSVPTLGEVYAKVRWRRHPSYGLAFLQTFRFDEMAQAAADLLAISRDRHDGGAAHTTIQRSAGTTG